ncbi:predicted protein [Lichtheimia corymbifera JMRC:FSU:9682]|uniref:Uncharacterized protein n=1 Tax=Lichtheimia corymbifera JMRC:FSU:9682 TaxID=1263082 RepID=A0A068RP98_9FUNG|nr:predicted protein [Lichtheimia corymbifera JMRC:FSU:9682]
MDDAISAIKYASRQAIFDWLGSNEMTKKQRDKQQDGKGCISAAITRLFSTSILVSMDACIKCSEEKRYWNVEDDDGLDGIDKRAYIFGRMVFCAAMDGIRILKAYYAATDLESWTKDGFDGSNQGYNDTITPVTVIRFTCILFKLLRCSFIILL